METTEQRGKGTYHTRKGKHAKMSSTQSERNNWIASRIVVLLLRCWDGCCTLLSIVVVEEHEKGNGSGLSRLGQKEMDWADKIKILVQGIAPDQTLREVGC